MVIKDQHILTMYENNFPLSILSKQSILTRITSTEANTDGIPIYPGGLPTVGIDVTQVAGAARNVSLTMGTKQWQLIGDIEIFDTPNGQLLSQLPLESLQFWVRGLIQHGYDAGLKEFLHLSYTPRAAIHVPKLSFELKK